MRQRLILHIGTHRTGSTSLQTWLWLNRPVLRLLGVHYPRAVVPDAFRGARHGDLRLAARTEARQGTPDPITGPFDALLDRYIDDITHSGAPAAILSCEGWSVQDNHHAPRLARLAERFDVQVVAFYRRPDHWVESFYRLRMRLAKHQELRSFETFLSRPQQIALTTQRHVMLGWWAEAFGAEKITVIPYEPLVPGFNLVRAFLKACNLRGRTLDVLSRLPLRRNPSLSREAAEALRRARLSGLSPDTADLRRLRRLLPEQGGVYLGQSSRAALLDAASGDMAAILPMVRDRRMDLFPERPERLAIQPDDWRCEKWETVPDLARWHR